MEFGKHQMPRDLREVKMPDGRQIRSLATFIPFILIAFILWNCWYTVEPEEVGVVLRFGKFVKETPPGLHFKLPPPFEKVIKVPVQRQLKEEFGFRTAIPGVRTTYVDRDYHNESLMLTGDLNVAVVEWITQYRIGDPYKFLFKVKSLRQTFRDMNEAVMRAVVGDRTVNEILTTGRQELADVAKVKLQKLCDQYETGIVIEQIVLQDVNPPDPVKPSFNEVNQAQQEKERMINDALAEYNKVIPRAKGEALRTIQEAEGYATDRINRAKGDAVFFNRLLDAYIMAPEITRRRLYLETMDEIYTKITKKIIVDQAVKGILPMLQLTQPTEKGGK